MYRQKRNYGGIFCNGLFQTRHFLQRTFLNSTFFEINSLDQNVLPKYLQIVTNKTIGQLLQKHFAQLTWPDCYNVGIETAKKKQTDK